MIEQLTDDELTQMLSDLESDRVERKQSFKGDVPKKARQAICAFANDLPNHQHYGVLFIGANDDGSPVGLPITDELLNTLADIKTDGNILPMPAMTVQKRQLKGAEMAVITVYPSDSPPVKYDGRIWIRTGARRALANAQEERILSEKRRFKNLPFDLHPVSNAQLSDLARGVFENDYLPSAFADDVLAENGRSYEERLAACRMIVSAEQPTPTVLGLLCLGKSPQDYLPGAYIQFLRIAGKELTDEVVDELKITGALAEMLRKIDDKLKSHNRIAMDITSQSTHQTQMNYPIVALQQLVYNAMLHRTYESTNAPVRVYWFDDRIEIHSPGGPFGNVTTRNFGQPGVTDYRNPNIADALKVFGFVQAFGRGIALAQKACEKNGNPLPNFEVTDHAVTVTVMQR